jgi:ATP-dependent Lhr-like helicase
METLSQIQGYPIAASMLESDVLGARHLQPGLRLDQLLAEGRVIWVGRGALGRRNGKVAFYLRDRLPHLDPQSESDLPDMPIHQAIQLHLQRRGASFFADIFGAAGGQDMADVIDALWDLVWAGLVTNDSLHPLRAHLRTRRFRQARSRNPRFPPDTAGRWSLVSHPEAPNPVSVTERYAAWGAQLLDRHGIVTRSVVAHEGIPGGFTALYPVLARMEETGKIRRGYFVEGLGGAQFALPGAVDRLREESDPHLIILASSDPANPYGAAIPWPKMEHVRLSRAAGCFVALWDGELTAFLDHRRLTTVPSDDLDPNILAEELAKLAKRNRRFRIDRIDGIVASDHSLAGPLADRGFVVSPKGLAFPPTTTRY